MLRRVLLLFFVSGALGLGYQVLWSKLVLLFVGVSSWSYAIVLAAFMAGLALGSRALGRVSDAAASPLRLFGWLELGIGAYAILYPSLTEAAGHAYLKLAAAANAPAGDPRLLALKAAVAALLLVPPTFLMGGTYPALVRCASASLESVGRRASQLYAVNAAGAVVGSLGMAMVVLPALGLTASLMLLALGNALVGGLAILAARRAPARLPAPSTPASPAGAPLPDEEPSRVNVVKLGLAVAFVAGFISFTLEVAWTREFSLVMGSSTQSFAAILAAFIAGIAGGSALVMRYESRVTSPLSAFGALQIATGLLVLAPLPLCQYLPWLVGRLTRPLPATEAGYQAWGAIKLAASLSVMLLPALCMGASVPLIVKAVSRRLEAVGADTGRVYAWNTAGNVLGALVAGMVLLPWLGVETLVRCAAVVSALAGATVIVLDGRGKRERGMVIGPAAAAFGVIVVAIVQPRWNPTWFSLESFRRHASPSFEAARQAVENREVIFFKDDPAANVMVVRGRGEDARILSLLTNGKPDASNHGDQPTQLLLAHLPLTLHGHAKSALVIGLASGVTSGAALRHPIERLDVIEIVGAMREAASYFDEWNGRPLEDPRTRLIVDDARSWLMSTTERYDVVISEPSNPWTAGTGSLFSTDFYERARLRLAPGGIYAQWLQAYELSDELLAATVLSFRRVFPHVTLWQTASLDVLMIGTLEPLAVDPERMATLLREPDIAKELGPLGIRAPGDIYFLQRFSAPTVDWLAAASPLENTDDNLLLEHRAPRDLFMLARPVVLEALDERRVAAPRLSWTSDIRAGRVDALAPAHLMSDRVFGTRALHGAWLAASMRTQGIPFEALPELLRAPVPASAGTPLSQDALVQLLRAATQAGDTPRLLEVLAGEHSALAVSGLMSPAAAEAWNAELASLAERAPGRAKVALHLVRADVLGAADREAEALAALDAALASDPPATVEEVVPRACRIASPGTCDAFARRMLDATGDPRLERFLELRATAR